MPTEHTATPTTTAERDRLRSLREFMATHEPCDGGLRLDVAETGEGLGITCTGCGKAIDYVVADPRPSRARPARTSHLDPVSGKPGSRAPAPRRRRSQRLATAALALVAAGAAAFAIARLIGANGEQKVSDSPTAGRLEAADAPAAGAAPTKSRSRDRENEGERGSAGGRAQASGRARAQRWQTHATEAFRIRAPAAWSADYEGVAFRLEPRSHPNVRVEIFHEADPGLTIAEMSSLTADLLAERHPRAEIAGPKGTDLIAGGRELRAHDRAGTETAIVLAGGEYRYLLLRWIGSAAALGEAEQARRIVRSFAPA